MDHPLGNHKTFARLKVDRPALEVDDEVPVQDEEELVVVLVFCASGTRPA